MVKSSPKENKPQKDRPLVLYDAVGATLIIALASVGTWSLFVHLPASQDRLKQARFELAGLRQSLRTVEANLHQSDAELARVEAEAHERGALPEAAPVDANLQAITRLLQKNQIGLKKVNPIGEKSYPGLTELNYKVHCESGFEAILNFLGDFEAEPFWADVSSLKIIGSPNLQASTNSGHKSELVVSLFATKSAKENDVRP